MHVLELVQKGELTTVRALTAALKQRVRDASEHALGNTDLPFEALMAQCSRQALLGTDGALHEPPRRCLDVVGASLSGSATVPAAYLWGALYRSPGARAELRVRLHLWREGVNDRVEQAVVPEVADGEALDALAERLVGRLLYPGRVSLVRVTAGDRAGGELYVDGRPRGALRATPRVFAVAPGERVFEVRAGVNVVARGTALVGPADGLEVRLEPVTAAPPAPTAPPAGGRPEPPPEPQRGAWKRTAGFVGLGLGAALIGAGVVTSLRVKSLSDSLDSERPFLAYRSGVSDYDGLCDAADADAASSLPGAATAGRVRRVCSGAATLQAMQFVFYGASALAVGAGAYLLATSPGAAAPPKAAAWSVLPWVGASGGGARLGLTF